MISRRSRWFFILGLVTSQFLGNVGAAQQAPAGDEVPAESVSEAPDETDDGSTGAASTDGSTGTESADGSTGAEPTSAVAPVDSAGAALAATDSPSDDATPEGSRLRLSFSSIRSWAGAELRMAASESDPFNPVCVLPCRTQLDPGEYHFDVLRTNGVAVPVSAALRFDTDSSISFKYGMSTRAWASAIVAATGILGVLITGGLTIAGAANDDRNLTIGGAVGLALASGLFVGGLIVFTRSERGLRATIRPVE